MKRILDADCIEKWFGKRRVLSAASLHARAGSITGLLGRNGCGKSTLIRVAAGWIAADSGIVIFDDERYTRPSLHKLAVRGLFYLPDRDILSPSIPLKAQLDAFSRRFEARPVLEVAEELGLSDRLDGLPSRLSSGERRRAEIAAAIVRRPCCLLADEPFRGVAPLDAELLARSLRGMANGGCAVVVSGHEVETVLDLADRITWCTDGTTREYGSPAAARADSRFQEGYFGFAA